MSKSKRVHKRQRRTFYESDIPEIAEWTQAQNNLGFSLEVIIQDAINYYGEGDVIRNLINNRSHIKEQQPRQAQQESVEQENESESIESKSENKESTKSLSKPEPIYEEQEVDNREEDAPIEEEEPIDEPMDAFAQKIAAQRREQEKDD